MASDAELLDDWRRGDPAAGNELLKRHFTSIYRFFRNKVDGDLEDLVQQVFMKCVQASKSLGPDSNFRAYLFAVARNVVADHYRHTQRRQEVDLGSTSIVDLGATPTMLLREKQDHQLLLSALRTIPLDDQVALELMYWERLSGREIAVVLGIPEGTVRTRIRGARAKLVASIERLSDSPDALESTLDNIERWSASIRDYLAADASATGR